MKKELCDSCGKPMRVITTNYRFDEVGLPVLLKNVEVAECKKCGTREPIIPNVDGLMQAIAFAVVTQPCKLTGSEVKFLRKYIGLSGAEFARLVHVEPETLSRWQNEKEEIGKNSDRLIRFIVVSKSPELRNQMEEFLNKYRDLTDCPPPKNPELKVDPVTLQYEYA